MVRCVPYARPHFDAALDDGGVDAGLGAYVVKRLKVPLALLPDTLGDAAESIFEHSASDGSGCLVIAGREEMIRHRKEVAEYLCLDQSSNARQKVARAQVLRHCLQNAERGRPFVHPS